MARIDSFLRLVVEQGASDLHFDAGQPPIIRVHGELLPLPFRKLSEEESKRFLIELLDDAQRAVFERERELDFLYALPGVGRFRANVFNQRQGASGVFRIIPDRPLKLTDLRMPSSVQNLCHAARGLVLIGGPTGSGKTTTLAAIVDEINRASKKHIITIEDPVEFLHEPQSSVITQRQVGTHVDSFAEALQSALRASPDVIVIGEMRDLDTMQLALQAAETGVLVFATLHTRSAARTISRILDMAGEEAREGMLWQLAGVLRGIISQRLVRRATGDGRVAAVEVLLVNSLVSSLMRENKVTQIEQLLQQATPDTGMQSMEACLATYVVDGMITLDEAMVVAHYPEQLKARVERALEQIA
jgi:twitching motility protein PilT